MKISDRRIGNAVVLEAAGRIDNDTSETFRLLLAPFLRECTREGVCLVLDLADVRYVSSAGLRVLLVAAKRLAGKGAFALSRASEPVRQVLDMTGFSGIIKVKPSLDEAVAQVSA